MKKKNTSPLPPLSPGLDFNKVPDEPIVDNQRSPFNHELAWRHYRLRISGSANEHEIIQLLRIYYEKYLLTANDLNEMALLLIDASAFNAAQVNKIVVAFCSKPPSATYANKPFAQQVRKWQLATLAFERTGNTCYFAIRQQLTREFYEMGLYGNPGSPIAELRYELELSSIQFSKT